MGFHAGKSHPLRLSIFCFYLSFSPSPSLFFPLSSFATPACDSAEELNPADVSPLIWNLLEGRSASPPARRSAIPAVPFNCIILSLAWNECIFLYSWINTQLSWFCPFHDCECPFVSLFCSRWRAAVQSYVDYYEAEIIYYLWLCFGPCKT